VREELSSSEKQRASDIATDLSLEYNVVISCFDYLYGAFKTWETPFLMSVRREGIEV